MVLVVRDGWGRNPNPSHNEFNALHLASTPVSDSLLKEYFWTLIQTSGEDVGLPTGTMGNSEVGHQNLGAGRVVNQESVRITQAIRDDSFFQNHALVQAVEEAKRKASSVHLMGLASNAGVHGTLKHLFACLELCRRHNFGSVYIHLFTDGRDTGPFSGLEFCRQVQDFVDRTGVGSIVSVCGRYYAMDRDNRWERVRLAYDALTGRSSPPHFESVTDAVQNYYDQATSSNLRGDEFVTPRTIGLDPTVTRIQNGDSVIFYNYRGDRPREITKALVLEKFYGEMPASPETGELGFDRGERLDLRYVTMTAYEEALNDWVDVAFPKPPRMDEIVGSYLAERGYTQFRAAETEKFPHVTFFFNDYRESPFPGESRAMAQSPKVATYDLQPEMSARQVCDSVLERLDAPDCEDFFLVNFANTDMVGHTGNLEAAIRAAEIVDGCVGELVRATLNRKGRLVVTADHGNAEQMWDPESQAPHTAHTTYPVECILVDESTRKVDHPNNPLPSPKLRSDGRLADVLPTLFALAGLETPDKMTGRSLLKP